MIRMGKFDFDPRKGQVVPHKEEPKSEHQIFNEVKTRRNDLIRAHKITDEELKQIITKVKSGTRNIRYLVDSGNYGRLRDIATYIVREYSYPL